MRQYRQGQARVRSHEEKIQAINRGVVDKRSWSQPKRGLAPKTLPSQMEEVTLEEVGVPFR